MNSIAIETWSRDKYYNVFKWLTAQFGPPSTTTWYADIQPLVEDLIMDDEIYSWYLLKWGEHVDQ